MTANTMTETLTEGPETLAGDDARDTPTEAACGAAGGHYGGQDDGFTPDTPEKADWVLGKIADARARAARVRENMELMAREADREAAFFEWKYGPALQDFLRGELGEAGRRKSVRLPNGVLGYRTRPAGVQIADTGAALAWARTHLPAAVVETVDRKALGAALLETLRDTEEVVDFAALTPAEETFYIK